MKRIWLNLAGTSLLLLAGCSDQGADPTSPSVGGGDDSGGVVEAVSYATDIQPIWQASCVGCHGENGQSGLDLRDGFSRGNLVGIDAFGYPAVLVVAGDPAVSVLYGKITDSGQFGGPMPPGGSLLSTDARELVRRWIADGAPDN